MKIILQLRHVCLMTGILLPVWCHAEVVVDNSFGTGKTIEANNSNYVIDHNQGNLVESNLFHSFETFSIETGHTATFTGPDGVQNIISRVTGDSSSNINGGISSPIPGVNFWLLNPNGILFGENASIDIQGSFHASTADYLKLRNDGIKISTDSTIFTNSPPFAFGFVDRPDDSRKIVINNAQLSVNDDSNISFVGSNIEINNSLITAKGGNISVVSIADSGEVLYSDQGLDSSDISEFGNLSINSTGFSVNKNQKGELDIKGGNIEINSHDTDIVNGISNLNVAFTENDVLLDEPCELASYHNQGTLSFIVNVDEDKTEYDLEGGIDDDGQSAIGSIKSLECL